MIGIPDPPPPRSKLEQLIDRLIKRRLTTLRQRVVLFLILFISWTAILVGYFTHQIANEGRHARRNICLQVENLKTQERARLTRQEHMLRQHRKDYIRRFGLDVIETSERENRERRKELTPTNCDHPTPPPNTSTR